MLTLMPDIEWPAKGQSLDHKRANSQKRGHCTPALARALDQARQARKEKHTHTVRGQTGTLEELVELLPSPVSASTVRRRLAGACPSRTRCSFHTYRRNQAIAHFSRCSHERTSDPVHWTDGPRHYRGTEDCHSTGDEVPAARRRERHGGKL